jgi:tripartite-type tricarboxylate transporter receptor subunit TctC
MRTLIRASLAALALLLSVPSQSFAQEFPSRTVRLIAGNQPGGPTDTIARLVADALTGIWGISVVVENRVGAGGTIAAELVANAPPDGHTLLIGGQTNLTAARAAYPNLRYDPLRDFAPVGRIATVPFAIAVSARVPVNTLQELVALARTRPASLTYGSLGKASMTTLPVHALEARLDIRMVEVPYSGSGVLYNDFIAGRIDVALLEFSRLRPLVTNGTVRLLATVGSRRPPSQPDVPTLAEQGITGIAFEGWYGLLAPAGVPREVVSQLSEALTQVVRRESFRDRLLRLDYLPVDDTPDEFRSAMTAQVEQLRALLPTAGTAVPR